MAIRRYGNRVAFWGTVTSAGVITGEAAGAGATSREVETARGESLLLFITSDGATTVSVEVAASSDSVAKDGPNQASDTGENWMPLYYLSGAAADKVEVILAGAGSAALMIPDFVAGWVRLRTSGAVTLSAGFESITES